MAFGIDVDIAGIKALRGQLNKLGRKKKLTAALRKRLTQTWLDGAESFILAAVQKVKVDTGMSAATFYALANEIKRAKAIGFIDAHIAQNRKNYQKKGVPTFPSGARREGFQGVAEGRRLGEKAFLIRVPHPQSKQIVFAFSFQTVAFQHALYEAMQQSLLAGIEAFEETITVRFEQDAQFLLDAFFKGRIVPEQGILS
jgi:hypothetical protein